MLKTISAMAAAAVLAGAAMLLPAMAPEAAAVAPVPAAKSDRADAPASCEHQGWPYYEANCLHDETRNAGRVPQVRIISTDRVDLHQPAGPVLEPVPQIQTAKIDAKIDAPANPLAVPAWPEHMANLQVLAIR